MAEIAYLCDHPEYAGAVSRWLYDAFVRRDDDDFAYETFHTYFQHNSKTEMPIRLIALADEKCVGTVTLIDNDFPGKTDTPWLGGLYVDTPYRNKGIGRNLINFVKRIAENFGYAELFLSTQNAGRYYQKLGWKRVETCVDASGRMAEIYRFEL